MDKYELAQYTDQNILQTALINQKEIYELVGDEELLTIHEIHHGFHMSSRYKIGISLPNEDSFYDSFRQGLEEHGILATVYELKETCKSFASHPPKWFEEEIVNRSNETRFNENWAVFLKTVYVENNWNDPLVQGWILCNKYNVKLYLIENNIDEENEYYVTRIVQNYSCEIVLSALIVSGQTKITIVNFGNHHFYPLVDTLAQMLKGKFGDVNYNKISRNKKKVNNRARGPTILENSLNYDVKPDILVKLNSLESTIKEGDVNTFKKLLNDLYKFNRNALIEVFHDPKNNIKNTNLVVLACKYNKLNILQYLINDFCPLHNFPLTDIKNNYKYKDDAIFYATLTFNKDMLVTLYDHFVDELHWSFNHHSKSTVENLKELNTILVKTSVNCEITLQENRQMSADLRCLIEVSKFQIELYTELDKIQYEICNSEDKRQVETETTVNIILTVIRIHNKYNLKYIKLNNPLTVERRIQMVLADKTSNFMENNHKFVFDLYYRKLDLNAALLILDNLHYLQQRLELPSKYYNEIESAIYYFIYRVYEDWRLFLPQNRMITRVELLLESDLKYKMGSVYDKTKLLLGPVLHLSRTYFCNELKKFGEVLQTTEIEKNIRKKGKKLSLGEINKLTLLPLMRDHFSLKKILVYLESMSKVDLDNDRDFAILMIERTIQVIGELWKISNESIHISLVTESLIEFMIPSEIIRYLRKMRDILSRFKIPQLLKRIHIMNAESDCFKQVLENLNDIKERIYYIIEMYHPILDKWILEQGLSILDKRIKELPVKNKRILKIQLLKMPPLNLPDSLIEYEDKLMKEHKISRQLLREINTLYINHNELTAIYRSVRIYSKQQISAKMDTFSTIILEKLRYIEKNAKHSQCLDEWEFIVKIFEYIIISMRFFDDHPYEIKHSACSNMIENIKNKSSIRNGLVKAFDLLAAIQNHAASYNITKENLLDDLTLKVNLENEFTGIKFLKIELQKCYNFIINDELKYVMNDFKNAYGNEADVVYSTYENVLNKIKNNIPIQSRDYKAICSLNLNDESKRIISYLDSKGKRTLKLGYCFENRIRLLKQLSGINMNVHDLASRYKHDERFRLCLEMLLIDIMNILKHIEQKATLKKENKLYTDANIRNILEHSEPLLEDIGKALDPNDFATALAKKAIEFVENADGWLDALNKLKK